MLIWGWGWTVWMWMLIGGWGPGVWMCILIWGWGWAVWVWMHIEWGLGPWSVDVDAYLGLGLDQTMHNRLTTHNKAKTQGAAGRTSPTRKLSKAHLRRRELNPGLLRDRRQY